MVIVPNVRADAGVIQAGMEGLECRASHDAAQRLDTIGDSWTQALPRDREPCELSHAARTYPWSAWAHHPHAAYRSPVTVCSWT